TWLFEPRRSGYTQKHSGSLQHPVQMGRPGHTINAFQHFVYQFTQNTQVLADIQSSASWDHNNRAPVLFDLMMHTTYRQFIPNINLISLLTKASRNMGAGDFGDRGIASFTDQHECVPRCAAFGLTPVGE
ncbi:hypothetical protein C8J56DRAFT_753806, partial [Mycena floridula]